MINKPFKLCTTSFIVPDNIIPNVKKLGPFFDEIELLVFESIPQSVIPSPQDVKTLAALSREHNLTYNIHMPVDVSLSKGSSKEKKTAEDILLKVIDRFSLLSPTTFTLHLEQPDHLHPSKNPEKNSLKQWQEQIHDSMSYFVSRLPNPEIISIETLNYPFSLVETVINDLGLSVCLDAGHLIKYNHGLEQTFKKYQHRIPVIHLHGVDFSKTPAKDHLSLDRLPHEHLEKIHHILKNFTNTLSLEVFNLDNLKRSLSTLSTWFNDIPTRLEIQ